MANCIDKILCDNSTKCNVSITNENGEEIDVRYLHDGEIIYLNAPNRKGYTFNGFTYQPNDGSSPYSISTKEEGDGRYSTEVICGGTYIANYSVNLYSLSAIPDLEIHGTTTGSGRYEFNTNVMISATEKPHYHFVGWYVGDTLISREISYFHTITEDIVFVAKFEADEYSIVGKPNNPLLGMVTGSGVYGYGTNVTLTAISLDGAWFVEWVDSNGDTNPNKTITVTQNQIFIAKFSKNKYTVTTKVINNSQSRSGEIPGIVMGDGEYAEGTLVQICAYPNRGFALETLDDGTHIETNNSCITFRIASNVEVIATFKDAEYTLSLSALPAEGGHFTKLPSTNSTYIGGTYPYNTRIKVRVNTYGGYTFEGWDDLSNDTVRTFIMDRDITATALFKKQPRNAKFEILYDPSKGYVEIFRGSNPHPIGVYENGRVYVANIIPGTTLIVKVYGNPGYSFVEWDDTPGSPQTPRQFRITEDETREVFFSVAPYSEICLCDDFTPNNNLRIKREGEPDSSYTYFSNNNRCFSYENGTVVIINYTDSDHFEEWDKSGLGNMHCLEYTDGNGYPCLKVTLTEDGEFCVKEKIMYSICYCNEWGVECVNPELYVIETDGSEPKFFSDNNCYQYEEGTELIIWNPTNGLCFNGWDTTDLEEKDIDYEVGNNENGYYLKFTLTDNVNFCINCLGEGEEGHTICACDGWDFETYGDIGLTFGSHQTVLTAEHPCANIGCIADVIVDCNPSLPFNELIITPPDGGEPTIIDIQWLPYSINGLQEGTTTICPRFQPEP